MTYCSIAIATVVVVVVVVTAAAASYTRENARLRTLYASNDVERSTKK
jgi:sensor domain CHASE-containing protein